LGKQGKIFISYRRGDVPGDARSVCERLERRFGKANVFMDVDRLLAGQRFDRELDKALSRSDVLIAIIGPRWMELLAEHARDGARDFVRDEISAALKRDIVIIPVLIGRENAMPPLPRKEDLPDDICDLVQYQKHSIVHESFGRDADHLIAAVKSVLGGGRDLMAWRPVAILGALALVLAALSLAYWMDMLPRSGEGPATPQQQSIGIDNAARVAQQKADADRAAASEAARKKAAEEESARVAAEQAKRQAETDAAKKKAEEEAANRKAAVDCDRLASSPSDTTRPSGVAGVEFDKIDPAAAATACGDAVQRYPEVGRFVLQAGRAEAARKNYAKAMERYRTAIDMGSAAATVELGELYYLGWGVKQDYVEARRWFEKGAALGDRNAQWRLGDLYRKGLGVPQDYVEALKWYEKSATLGDPVAMALLGYTYETGQGVPQDFLKARDWYEKAAALGNASAMSNLAGLYRTGKGGAQNYATALAWYEKSATLGLAAAMYGLGVIYEDGEGVAKDTEQARKWYQKAADAGYESAKEKLKSFK
jgi:TPR repeat protein